MLHNKLLIAAVALAVVSGAHAADTPRPSAGDPRIGIVTYDAANVVSVPVRRGVATRVVFAADERIATPPVSGLSARCEGDTDEWCISASVGDNQMYVRPRDGATRTNVEVRTDRRDYSLEFVVQPDVKPARGRKAAEKPRTDDALYRVVFEYPKPRAKEARAPAAALAAPGAAVDPRVAAAAAALAALPVTPDSPLAQPLSPLARLKAEPVKVCNAAYSMQVVAGGGDIAPSSVFDDCRFTYFEFPGAREVPAIFVYGADGAEARVNWHMQGDYLVVERTARKFTLRLGPAVVGVFNDAFDAVGVSLPTSTISADVVRRIKGDKDE